MVLCTELCTKTYKQGETSIEVIHGATIEISQTINMFVGKSGSGKTTFMKMLAGYEPPTTGDIFFKNKKLYATEEQIEALHKKHISYIFQSYNLVSELSVLDNILLPFYIREQSFQDHKLLNRLLEIGHLSKGILQRMPSSLSGGEQQRVAIIRAFLCKPSVIFADEPTGNLDEENSRAIISNLVELCRQANITLVMATHDSDLLSYADAVFQIKDGMIHTL